MMPRKTILTLVALAALLRVPDLMPAFKDYKVLDWSTIPHVADFEPRRASADPVEDERSRLQPSLDAVGGARHLVGDLDSFYRALADVDAGMSRTVNVLHYGDSPTTADMITADVRSLLQKRFGDAGHGYHLIAKPWAWYQHDGVAISAQNWRITPANQGGAPGRDGLYGLGGVSFVGGAGSESRLTLRAPASRLDLDYMPTAGGGRVTITADGSTVAVVDTAGGTGHATATFPPASRIEMRADGGPARLFGVSFSNGAPGIVYHSLGLNGAYISVLSRMFNEAHWSSRLTYLSPDLVIINYGTNESVYANFVDTTFEGELRRTIARVRAAVPTASILVMSPMDRGQRDATGQIGTVPALSRLVATERRVSAELGVAFFDTFTAMGGPGTMGRWYAAEPRLVGADFIHPMPNGAKIVGNLLYQALMTGYQRHKTRQLKERYAEQITLPKPPSKRQQEAKKHATAAQAPASKKQ